MSNPDSNEAIDVLFERFERRKAEKPDPVDPSKLDLSVERLDRILPGRRYRETRAALRQVARNGSEEAFNLICATAEFDKLTVARVARSLLQQKRRGEL